ncbi:glycosyltransferase family 2 protein [Candidatus Woesebacteria bacterium]|nr:glycosyltransferase family 2 protein [Candidatus Woesebacteria bacterium]
MKKRVRLSVVIATHNEEENLPLSLPPLVGFADEILIADGESTDNTVKIAKSFGATVIPMTNKRMFHHNKQAAGDQASGEWILYLDADEIVTDALKEEILQILDGNHPSLQGVATADYLPTTVRKAYLAHLHNLEVRDQKKFQTSQRITAYFIARKNWFLGAYLMHAGVFPDGVIRLVKKGTAVWPCKDVHETMDVQGGVGWLIEPMLHQADPTFSRYLMRANRYTNLTADQLTSMHVPISFSSWIYYLIWKPLKIFVLLFFRHKGFKDGFSGFVWALMSGLHWPIAFLKYVESSYTRGH